METLSSTKPPARHLILLSVDALRFDMLPAVEDKVYLKPLVLERTVSVPSLERLCENGISFTNVTTTAPCTPPAHLSLLTGLYPPQHGLRSFYWGRLQEDVKTIAYHLKKLGYVSFFLTDSRYFFRVLGLHKDFDYYFELDEKGFFERLKGFSQEKVFIFAHFYDVHAPYLYFFDPSYKNTRRIYRDQIISLAKRFKIRVDEGVVEERYWEVWSALTEFLARADLSQEVLFPLYIKGVNLFDRVRLGPFLERLEKLGFLEDFFLVLTSDHGDGYNPITRRFGHGDSLREEVIRIPLVVVGNFISHGVYEKEVSIVDIPRSFLSQEDGIFRIISGEDGSPSYGELGLDDLGEFGDVHRFAEACFKEGRLIKRESFIAARFFRSYPYKVVLRGDVVPDGCFLDHGEFFRFCKAFFGRAFNEKEINALWEKISSFPRGRRRIVAEGMRLDLGIPHALYEVSRDPFERVNLLYVGGRFERIFQELKGKADLISRTSPPISQGEEVTEDEEVLKHLKELGYV